MTMEIGLVMQGGGALGAYEVGALTRIYEEGYRPSIITGTSIGALNAAVLAAPKDGDPIHCLHALWEHLKHSPGFIWHSSQKILQYGLGHPRFFKLHSRHWLGADGPSIYDITPAIETMEQFIDFEQLNHEDAPRVVITATNVVTGEIERFSNRTHELTAHHIMASGSLPPGFPPIELHGNHYWDGGIYDNTPVRSLLQVLDEHQVAHMPIFVLELFCPEGTVPQSVEESIDRMTELVYEDKFWTMLDGHRSAQEFSRMIWELDHLVPEDHAMRDTAQYKNLMKMRAISHILTIKAEHSPLSGVVDFAPETITERMKAGYRAAIECLHRQGDRIQDILENPNPGHLTDDLHSKHRPHPDERSAS